MALLVLEFSSVNTAQDGRSFGIEQACRVRGRAGTYNRLRAEVTMNPTPIHELPRLPRRSHSGHKGTYGKVLVVAGSRGMSGAAVLCGRAALRSGAGLVQVAAPADVQPIVAASYPAYTTIP